LKHRTAIHSTYYCSLKLIPYFICLIKGVKICIPTTIRNLDSEEPTSMVNLEALREYMYTQNGCSGFIL